MELISYDWLTTTDKGQALDGLTMKRIKSSLERQLAAKGYNVDTADPDFLIAIHGGKEKKVNVVDWGYDYRRYDNYYGYARRDQRIDVYQYEEGSLILDIVDAARRELIWRGSVTKVIDPDPTP